MMKYILNTKTHLRRKQSKHIYAYLATHTTLPRNDDKR